ncbi:acetyltransferase [Shewanella donghaensis]|uniref:acetyltransferase n=1 Tax=Shewanella donghaensis TaxID=238836 RepID=UPI0011833B3B|nr:acetyltransferase [Shewanella donghaensis]
MKKLAILGASGHGKVIAEIAELTGLWDISFFDDAWPSISTVEHWPISGNGDDLITSVSDFDGFIIAIGNNKVRWQKQECLLRAGGKAITLIHPTAVISQYSNIGTGTVIMANAVVGSFARVGHAVICNTACSIDHDCDISNGVHISPGARLAGQVTIERCSWVGMGASVIQQIHIGSHVIIGAGSTVIRNIIANDTVVGSPAKSVISK